jgi:cytochrome P450
VTTLTTSSSLADAVTAWFFEPVARHEPDPLFDRLRADDPVHYCEAVDSWVLTRYADANKVFRSSHALRSPAAGRNGDYLYTPDGELRPCQAIAWRSIRYSEGDAHVRIRMLVGRALNSPNVARWQEFMEAEVEKALEPLRGRTEMDLMADFAYELPLRQICRILGIPDRDVDDYKRWTSDILTGQVFNASEEVMARGDEAALAFRAHVDELIAFHRTRPGPDLLSAMIEARDGGDMLADEEIVCITAGLLAAGHETTAALIGNTTLALMRHPDEFERLRGDLSLLPEAVEEGLRYEGSAQWVPRFALDGLEVDGVPIGKGDQVVLVLRAANRDPEAFSEPHRYVIGRPEKAHLAFAAGAHSCIGPHLARAETRTALSAIVTEFPNLELAGDYHYVEMSTVRHLATLPVRWG